MTPFLEGVAKQAKLEKEIEKIDRTIDKKSYGFYDLTTSEMVIAKETNMRN